MNGIINFVKVVITIVFSSMIVIGCSSNLVKPHLKFDTIIIQNHSAMSLEDVKIKVEKTRAMAYCSVILPRSSCSTSFPVKFYQHNPVYISWFYNRQARVVGPVMVALPNKLKREMNASVLIEFDPSGKVLAKFVY